MRFSKIAMAATGAIAMSIAVTSPASAMGDDENMISSETCKSSSTFKMRFHYNSNYKGAYRNLGYSQYDIGAAVGSPALGVMALKYCSGTGAGAGTGVKNNAASVTNSHPTYLGVIYYNSGYKGVADVCAWSMNLVNTYNNNASFRWE